MNYVVLWVTPNLSIKSQNDYYLSQQLTKKANFTVSIVPLLQEKCVGVQQMYIPPVILSVENNLFSVQLELYQRCRKQADC